MQCIDGVKGLTGVSWGQPKVKLPRNAIWLLGVIRGQPEGNYLEMRRAIKCSQYYRALCSCRYSSHVLNQLKLHISCLENRNTIMWYQCILYIQDSNMWCYLRVIRQRSYKISVPCSCQKKPFFELPFTRDPHFECFWPTLYPMTPFQNIFLYPTTPYFGCFIDH